jgi:tetratricopeptide (TPR) repeat protein
MSDSMSEFEFSFSQGQHSYREEQVYLDLIDEYLASGNTQMAQAAGKEGLQQHPFSIDLLCSYASVLLEMDKPAAALAILDHASSMAPGEAEVEFLRVETLIELDRPEEASHILEPLLQMADGQDRADAWYFKSMVEETRENWIEAHRALTQAVSLNPQFQEALERLWLCTEMLGNYAESAVFYQRVLDKDPYSWQVWYNLGHAYACLEDLPSALEAFDYASIINEDFEYIWRDLGDIWLQMGNAAKAAECLEIALTKCESPDPDLLTRLGDALEQQSRHPEAILRYQEAITIDPAQDEAHYHLGCLFMMQDDVQRAAFHLEAAIAHQSEREEYYIALAEVYFSQGLNASAEDCLHRALELAPEQSAYWLQYASYLLDEGAFEEALHILDAAMLQHPIPQLEYARIACLFKLGKRQEACQTLCLQLAEDFPAHQTLLDLAPELVHDPDVISLVRAFRVEDE